MNYENAKCIILPTNKWKLRWNVLVSILLVWTALLVPIKVSFFDESSVLSVVTDCMIDACFITDIVLTFFTALERRDGMVEVRHRYIAKTYIRAWFWIDIFSSLPFQLLELPLF